MRAAKCFQAALRRFEFGVAAAFLLEEVVLESAPFSAAAKISFQGADAFSEQDFVALGGRPVFAVHRLDTAGMGADPGDRIGAGCDTRAHVKLQDNRWLGVLARYSAGYLPSTRRNSGS